MTTNIQKAKIGWTATIASVFKQLESNGLGIVFVADADDRIVGCATDGDIRRQLLIDNSFEVSVANFMNRDFVRADAAASREQILKLLDHRVHVVPLLDDKGRLAGLCTRDEFRLQEEAEVFARARAPARISFGGGGSDLTHYFVEQGGMVISATIAKYAYTSLRQRADKCIRIYSHDLKTSVNANCIDDLQFDGTLDLIKSVIRLIAPTYGFELEAGTDFPVGSGLGGSAALAVSIIGCFNEFRAAPWNRHQIAEMAFQAERLSLNIPGGWQDQYAAAFGGFNYMEFSADENLITPLRLEPNVLRELEANLILCYTNKTHNSGQIHADQKKQVLSSDAAQTALQRQKDMTKDMKRRLLRGDIYDYGSLLHEAWLAKREMSALISDSDTDRIYDCAMANGALGGKILGAGGGGYFMFFAPPFERYRVINALAELGYACERVGFDEAGLVSWKARISNAANAK